jgi:hypothetical protein
VQRDYYAWEFSFTFEGCSIEAVLQRLDKWILTLGFHSSWKNPKSYTRESVLGAVAEAVAQALTLDLGCEVVTVYSDAELPY